MTLTALQVPSCCSSHSSLLRMACCIYALLISGVKAWRDSTTDGKSVALAETVLGAQVNISLLELDEASSLSMATETTPSASKGHGLTHIQYHVADDAHLAHVKSQLLELQNRETSRIDGTHASLLGETEAILRNSAAVMTEHQGLQQQQQLELVLPDATVKNKMILSLINMLAMVSQVHTGSATRG
eukprot:5562152-Amphidinium_carterae.2